MYIYIYIYEAGPEAAPTEPLLPGAEASATATAIIIVYLLLFCISYN